jgi:hypothetical protein
VSCQKEDQARSLQKGISLLASLLPSPLPKSTLSGQPFDAHLLSLSSLYQRSRTLFLKGGGSFEPSFISSPRTLSSPSLLSQVIEYSPLERELIWAATDFVQKRNPKYLLTLRTCVSSIYHEQNHRILWKILPSAPKNKNDLRKYLNFVESLVIAMDMALGDELGSAIANLFHLHGTTYDPGTEIRQTITQRRSYRNYLQATTYATYLNLELYSPKDIHKIISALFPMLGPLTERAVRRSIQLDRAFVQKTNPLWQRKHFKAVIDQLSQSNHEPLILSDHPADNRLQYLWTETWLDLFNL